MARDRIGGVILAGGAARRMGGGDKGLMLLGGKPLLAHVQARLAPQVAALALSANGDAARFAAFGLPVIADPLPGSLGPLAGVLAGLNWAQAQGFEAIATAPVDTPFLPADLVERLLAAGRDGPSHAGTAERSHHTLALWPVSLRDPLMRALQRGQRRLGAFAADHASTPALFEEEAPFANINTPADLAEAQHRLRPRA
ncbi:molybdenum cofactor guanylyltransferase MobA [Pseudoroseicyclus aestuarii]|uniref:Molybdenum cofactor guanylyltransferase n=1 Tax=Pseudoroseicyclus aestuarii TaxID=1795041 RepID=A0A318SUF0_9RHOB|nr:molybdenum cofactor guanylyltransferase MobA [Pseudoroseicyclus aestuarii]PYE85102.1 molybdenum cofactor guanylyltransferase [Pseudoroseicyclus aestuarii]